MAVLSKTDIHKLKKGDAVSHLEKLGLSTSGKRPELLARLVAHCYPVPGAPSLSKITKPTEPKPPSKSAIRIMKVKDIATKLKELYLPYDGDKNTLVQRLDEYYRPTKKAKIETSGFEVKTQSIPTKIDIQKMTREQLEKNLIKLNLKIDDSLLFMAKRLEDYYYSSKKIDFDSDSDSEFDLKKKVDNPVPNKEQNQSVEVRIQIFEYNHQLIGICADTLTIYEKHNDEWEPTSRKWNMEENCPVGFETNQ